MKEVNYEQYCKTCIYLNEPEESDICHECLSTPSREDSHRPVNYKEDTKLIEKLKKEEEKRAKINVRSGRKLTSRIVGRNRKSDES